MRVDGSTGLPQFDPEFAGPADWARMYRSVRLQVVPCRTPEEDPNWKRPAISEWKTLQEDLVPEISFLRWYGRDGQYGRRANMGLITGRCSGNIFVIDLDDHKTPQAAAWWVGLLEEHYWGREPHTWQQRTGGGGRQLFFRGPKGWTAPTNKTPIGVDIRGQGGFAVMPPSIHETKREYAWAPDCAPWEVHIEDAAPWLIRAIEALVAEHGGSSSGTAAERTPSPGNEVDAFGARIDGREEYMRNMVWATVVDWCRESPIKPPKEESWQKMLATYQTYLRSVKTRFPGVDTEEGLEREGRGLSLFQDKWARAMAQWEPKVQYAAMEARSKHEESGAHQKEKSSSEKATGAHAGVYEYLDIPAIKAQPDAKWAVRDLIIEDSLGFFYGPPGHGKTFVCLNLALHIAYGAPAWWWEKQIQRHGLVIYVAREGVAGLKDRIEAWQRQHGIADDAGQFVLIKVGINFMVEADIAKLLATIEAAAEQINTSPAIIFVDTVSRVLPGADENLQREMTIFVAACDALRDRFRVTVVGVHHAGKSGDMRGSTVLKGAGDFVFKIERPEEGGSTQFLAEKIKDSEDGWSKDIELRPEEWERVGAIDAHRKSMVAQPIGDRPKPKGTPNQAGWPDPGVCQRILNMAAEAWARREPWSPYPRAKREGRFAPAVIYGAFGIPAKLAESMIETWLMNDVLALEVCDQHTKTRGLKVVGSIR